MRYARTVYQKREEKKCDEKVIQRAKRLDFSLTLQTTRKPYIFEYGEPFEIPETSVQTPQR
jgi:hypothetical protein